MEDFKKQIQDKTQMIDSSNLRASELCKLAQLALTQNLPPDLNVASFAHSG